MTDVEKRDPPLSAITKAQLESPHWWAWDIYEAQEINMILGTLQNVKNWLLDEVEKQKPAQSFKSSSDPHVNDVEQTVILMHRDFFYQVLWCLYVSVCVSMWGWNWVRRLWIFGDLLVCVQIFIFNERSVVVSMCETSLACWSFLWFSCWWRINWISGLLAQTEEVLFLVPVYQAYETFIVLLILKKQKCRIILYYPK